MLRAGGPSEFAVCDSHAGGYWFYAYSRGIFLPSLAEEVLTPESESTTLSGDIWQFGEHRLICGDCRDENVLKKLCGDDRASMVFTDPPYNVPIKGHVSGLGVVQHDEFVMASGEMSDQEFYEFLRDACATLSNFSTDGSLHYVCMDWRHIQILLAVGGSIYFALVNLCIWAKTNGG